MQYKNILLIDGVSCKHIGNGILLEETIKVAERLYRPESITVVTSDYSNCTHKNKYHDIFSYEVKQKSKLQKIFWLPKYIVFITKLFLSEYFSVQTNDVTVTAIKRADLILAMSGEWLNGHYYPEMYMRAIIAFIVSLKHTFIIFPQSIGPLNTRQRRILSILLSRIETVYARDMASQKEATQIFNKEKIKFCPDVCINKYKKEKFQKWKEAEITVGVTISSTPPEIISKYPLHVEIFNVLKRFQKLNVKILPSNYDNMVVSQDYEISLKLNKLLKDEGMNVQILDNKIHALDFFESELSKCNLVISSRMHVSILSCVLGIPNIGINTQRKIREFHKMIDHDEYVFDLNEINGIEKILENFDQSAYEFHQNKLRSGLDKLNDKFIF